MTIFYRPRLRTSLGFPLHRTCLEPVFAMFDRNPRAAGVPAVCVKKRFRIPAGCLRFTILLLPVLGGFSAGCADFQQPKPSDPAAAAARSEFEVLPESYQEHAEKGPDASAPELSPRFRNVAASAGVDFRYFNDEIPERYFLPEIMGGGISWVDYDSDGALDLYVMNGCRLKDPDLQQTDHLNRLYRNLGNGRFADVTPFSGSHNAGYGQGCAAGDFNADGFPDLYLCNYGVNALLVNNGDGTFTDVTDQAGVGDPLWGSSSVWFDVNDDGLLDLYVANYLYVDFRNTKICEYGEEPGYCGPGSYEGQPDRVYRNQGDGRFVESAAELGFAGNNGKGLAVIAADFDLDLRADVYVANDMVPNFLFTRSEVGIGEEAEKALYAEVAEVAGCAVADNGQYEASMGIACVDFDNDGLIDIFLTHFYGHKNTLYRNLGEMLFDDHSYRSRAAKTGFETLGFGTVPLDYDRDGASDLFIANGHVLGPHYEPSTLRPQLIRNDGRGVLTDISNYAGDYFQHKYLGRGAAAADCDNDGDIDIAVSHLHHPMALLQNETETPGRHFLGLSLKTRNRIPPVGGRVVVTAGEIRQIMPVTAGGSYLCTNDNRILIGLDTWAVSVGVEVFWPSGRKDKFQLSADRYWHIMEGSEPELLHPNEAIETGDSTAARHGNSTPGVAPWIERNQVSVSRDQQ